MDADPQAQQTLTQDAAQQIRVLKEQITHLSALVTHWQQAEADKARLLVLEREQRLLAESLVEATTALTSRTSQDQVFDLILDHAQRLVPCAATNVMLLDGDVLRVVRQRGYQAFGCDKFVDHLSEPLPRLPLEAQIVRSAQPLVVPDTRAAPDWVVYPGTSWIRSHLAVPICLQEQVLGLLELDSDVPGHFTLADAQRLAPLANVAAVALENTRLLEASQRQAQQLEALVQVARDMSALRDLDTLLRQIVEWAVQLLDGTAGSLFLLRPEQDRLEGIIVTGTHNAQPGAIRKRGQGLSGKIWETGQPLIVDDYGQWPGRQEQPVDMTGVGVVGVPIRWGDQFLGVLTVDAPNKQRRFNRTDAALLSQLATQAAIAIHNARLFEATQRQAHQLQVLAEITRDLTALHDLDVLLNTIVERAMQLLGGHSGNIFLLRPELGVLEEVITVGDQTTHPTKVRRPGEGLSGKVWQAGQPMIVADYGSWPGRLPGSPPAPYLTVVSVPIRWGEEFLGVLDVAADNRQRRFTQADADLLQQMASQAAIAIHNARLITQLEQHVSQVQLIMDTVPDGMVLLDNTGRVVMANPAGLRHLSDLARATVGDHLSHLGDQLIEDLLTTAQEPLPREVTIPASDAEQAGRPRVFEVTTRPLQGAELRGGWVLIIREVTRERELHQRAEEQERLAAVGQLAAGIAHDFNNILQVIIGFAELLLLRGEVSDSVKRDLERISQQGQRAGQLVRQLLDFARRSVSIRQTLDMQAFLEGILKWLRRAIPEHIRIQLEVTPGRYLVSADSAQLEQALTNLAVNARDAMPEGGELRLRLTHLFLQPGQPPPDGCPDLPAGDWITLAVSDTGVGIAPDVLPHIFEPFFTTKPIGKGTGLGLAQVFGIVKQHMGYIGVVSQPGRGTTFTVYLPSLRESSEAGSQPADREQMPLGHGQLIMLVEDDDIVREATQSMLEYLNYRVLPVSDGHTALDTYACHADEIALVLTDMTMPELSGLALAEKLRANYPEAKLLAMTGYAMDVREPELQASGFLGWLSKPLDIGELAHAIHRATGL